MTIPQGGQPLDINAIQLNATHNEMAEITKMLASRSGNHVGQVGRLMAEKAMLEEENARLKAENERLTKAAGETEAAPDKAPEKAPEKAKA